MDFGISNCPVSQKKKTFCWGISLLSVESTGELGGNMYKYFGIL